MPELFAEMEVHFTTFVQFSNPKFKLKMNNCKFLEQATILILYPVHVYYRERI